MKKPVTLLDCTLRDGAYIVDADFGVPAMKGIIRRLQDANLEIIECGWLKDTPHKQGTTYYHVPADIKPYLLEKNDHTLLVAMIDWDRYDLSSLPPYDGETIGAVRVVFPKEHFREGIALGKTIHRKGYQVFFQASNTLAYSDKELEQLAEEINDSAAQSLSVVDTFGAMDYEDLERIIGILDEKLRPDIMLGFHSHNNRQMSFAMSQIFVQKLYGKREVIVDASLCGMGRGAGNTTTELIAGFLNKKYHTGYDMNIILDTIDTYMNHFQSRYSWGYSTPYFIAGTYCAHVNNISYLLDNHRTSALEMHSIISSLSERQRSKYDYDLLEQKYLEYRNQSVDDHAVYDTLKAAFQNRKILLLSPGASLKREKKKIRDYIGKENPVCIGINAVSADYEYDYLFFSNQMRYAYAKDVYPEVLRSKDRILLSNIKNHAKDGEYIVNFNMLIKRGWPHFDNATILCLRLLGKLHVKEAALAGFDGFSEFHKDNYADEGLPRINPGMSIEELNEEIRDMFRNFRQSVQGQMEIGFITDSKFAQ